MNNADGGARRAAGGTRGAGPGDGAGGGGDKPRLGTRARIPLRILAAGLLAASAAIHLDLYRTGYSSIPTIGPLFLVQVIAGFLLAALVLLTGNRVICALAALFALGTLAGYLASLRFGLFGFREVRTTAGILAGVLDVLAFALLTVLALSRLSNLGRATSSGVNSSMRQARAGARVLRSGMRARKDEPGGVHRAPDLSSSLGSARGKPAAPRRAIPGMNPVLAGVTAGILSLAALGVLSAGLAFGRDNGGHSGQGAEGRNQSGSGALRTTTINGTKVLTDSSGMTLYWFAPDSAGKSVCTGSCAAYWPPVSGTANPPAGVPGHFATIQRPGGHGTQETYNGHPLYTYIGDSAPGQARGNKVNLNGGFWYEMQVSGK